MTLTLVLSDFLADTASRQARALDALGLSKKAGLEPNRSDTGAILRRVSDVASGLETRILEYLRRQGATARHFVDPERNDRSKLLRFEWPTIYGPAISGDITFSVRLALVESPAGRLFDSTATLAADVSGARREQSMKLPAVDDSAGANDRLGEQTEAAIGALAAALLQRQNEER